MTTVLLLVLSNLFMTVAWYWHIQGGPQAVASRPLLMVIGISWAIALIEYCFAVPANRIGALNGWSAGQLKIAQEAIALIVFGVFMVLILKEPLHWRHFAAFACIMAAVAFLFTGK
ncbi:DMT family protein [Novosphingobium sp. SL115]|uniref:DMT family protein n=1 Tax=Novosphingobium sp. SL115 TaxID=2995150 RepID=UPI0022744B0E|nr:DMT family protein [Novosphingobium sp. SL115]MCY1670120.1 DMT family protein [Novosphingobium sp. SL115]